MAQDHFALRDCHDFPPKLPAILEENHVPVFTGSPNRWRILPSIDDHSSIRRLIELHALDHSIPEKIRIRPHRQFRAQTGKARQREEEERGWEASASHKSK